MARGVKGMCPDGACCLPDDLLHLLTDRLERNPEALQGLSGDTLTLVDEAQEDVLGADVVVVEHPGFFLTRTTTRRARSVNLSNIVNRSSERSGSKGTLPSLSFRSFMPASGSRFVQLPTPSLAS